MAPIPPTPLKVDCKPLVESCNMPKALKEHAIKFVEPLILQQKNEDDISNLLREEFDNKYGRGWNCVVGRDFAAFVHHEPKTMLFFYADRTAILLFKAK